MLAAALVIGNAIGYMDSRATWDDAGVTAGTTFLFSAILSAVAPRFAWLVAAAIGLPVLAWNVVATGNFGSAAAVGIALVGAGVGFALRRFATPSHTSAS